MCMNVNDLLGTTMRDDVTIVVHSHSATVASAPARPTTVIVVVPARVLQLLLFPLQHLLRVVRRQGHPAAWLRVVCVVHADLVV